MDSSQRELVRLLRAAYSGEMAAAYAYRGHWKALRDFEEKEKVYQIEDEEWSHRRELRGMLDYLGARPHYPHYLREALMYLTGRAVGLMCRVTGRFLPMYFAGWLESGNVREYETASLRAGRLGLKGFEKELRAMAAAEGSHERFFARMVSRHRLRPLMRALFRW